MKIKFNWVEIGATLIVSALMAGFVINVLVYISN